MPEGKISRHPAREDFSFYFPRISSIPKYDPNSREIWQVDLRSQDLTELDMTGSLTDLMYASFDSKTQWPQASRMPADLDPQKIMETGKDPGLEIRDLHKAGVTGTGVAMAIVVDQPLLVDHQEYKDR